MARCISPPFDGPGCELAVGNQLLHPVTSISSWRISRDGIYNNRRTGRVHAMTDRTL